MLKLNAALRFAASALVLGGALNGAALASEVLIDRGLPSANLNNAAGANRSNVAWVDGGQTAAAPTPADYWMEGDSFTNTGSQNWYISNIRVWTVGATSTATLWGGIDGSSITVAAASGTVSGPVTYAGGASYQGSSGSFINLYAVDFAVNIVLTAGQTYDFFFDGSGGNYVIPFLHASNAALSGSPQDGANNLLLEARVVGGVVVSQDAWSSLGNGWDKASDINVQVSGEVPEPATFALAGLALFGVAASRRRKA
jgi:hypothetical protein